MDEVAPRLLGARLQHGEVAVRIVEVEAYGGPGDPASHAHRGETRRNRVMFGPAGHLYCYLSHGIHVCANVSVGPPGEPAAVLLRAGEIVEGVDIARPRRGTSTRDRDLARGPGRLCQALAISLREDGTDLAQGGVRLWPGEAAAPTETGPRVGVRRAADRPWRFWLRGAAVSDYRRHAAAGAEW